MRKSVEVPFSERITLSVDEVAAAYGFSPASIYNFIRDQKLPSKRIGRRRVIPRQACDDFFLKGAALATLTPSGHIAIAAVVSPAPLESTTA